MWSVVCTTLGMLACWAPQTDPPLPAWFTLISWASFPASPVTSTASAIFCFQRPALLLQASFLVFAEKDAEGATFLETLYLQNYVLSSLAFSWWLNKMLSSWLGVLAGDFAGWEHCLWCSVFGALEMSVPASLFITPQ